MEQIPRAQSGARNDSSRMGRFRPKEIGATEKVTPMLLVALTKLAYFPPKVKFTPAEYLKLFWFAV